MILSEFIPNHQLGKSEISHCVEQTWNNLLSRTGESTPRLRTLAITFIQVSRLLKYFIFLHLQWSDSCSYLGQQKNISCWLEKNSLSMLWWPDLLRIFIDDWEWMSEWLSEGVIYTGGSLWKWTSLWTGIVKYLWFSVNMNIDLIFYRNHAMKFPHFNLPNFVWYSFIS